MHISINPAAKEAVTALFNMITIEDIIDYLARYAPTFEPAEVTYGFGIKKKDGYRYFMTDKFEPGTEIQVIGFKPLNAGPKRFMKSTKQVANIAQSGILIIISSSKAAEEWWSGVVAVRESRGDGLYGGKLLRRLSEEYTESLKEKLKNLLK